MQVSHGVQVLRALYAGEAGARMNDEKVEHLRRLAERRVCRGQNRLVRRVLGEAGSVAGGEWAGGDAGSNGWLGAITNRSGIPFLFSILGTKDGKDINHVTLRETYAKYEVFEENIINLLEIFSFIASYLVSSISNKRRWFRKFLKFIDKLLLLLRFKILITKIYKLYNLQQGDSQPSHTITIREGADPQDKNEGLDRSKENVDESDQSEQEKVLELVWKQAQEKCDSAEENDNNNNNNKLTEIKSEELLPADISALENYKSTEKEIQDLRIEIIVEFIDFLLLLYPKSITQTIYNKLFNGKSKKE